MIDKNKYASVSVIIPCYRCDDVLNRAIESVFNQTILPLEIICVDDFSNDGDKTLRTIYELEHKYNSILGKEWIKHIELKINRGPGAARNAAWEICNGDYIAFLDADDAWDSHKIDIQYSFMIKNNNCILCGHQSKEVDHISSELINLSLIDKKVSFRKLLLKNMFLTRTVMIKRDTPYRFPEKYIGEDYLLWIHILNCGSDARVLNLTLAYSFKEDRQHLTRNLIKAHHGEIDVLNTIKEEGIINIVEYVFLRFFYFIKYRIRIIRSR